ncbi:heat-shock protein Hsp20 [Longimycelium tulufanense]|uniref:Heat-shock protein Hsp20 n=1 Tax=Longimycelium tulufanense TaxID=907463 RepID=A0A8J3FW52_9PSEU|nr:Hsp20/alpha crystallin family protein [Longimycelium tulufanense]GGM56851.1 heat-shock protein Hsp20 [Longimycelium tulufanense]
MTTLPAPRSEHPTTRWDPFREFEDLYTQMGRLWESVLGPNLASTAGWSPLADVCETDDAYIVDVEVPGVREEDLNVEMVGTELAVTGELRETRREGLVRRRTRRTGHFEYRTSLPHDVDAERIEANLADGVLTLRIPKAEGAKPRRIQITRR